MAEINNQDEVYENMLKDIYESPIRITVSEMRMQMEGQILKAVKDVGVVVDKEELLKALEYDREQYDKGFAEGEKKGRVDAIEEIERAMYHQAFNVDHEKDGLQKWDSGNWIRYKLFENVIEQLKEQK